jgi:hypothetical protein
VRIFSMTSTIRVTDSEYRYLFSERLRAIGDVRAMMRDQGHPWRGLDDLLRASLRVVGRSQDGSLRAEVVVSLPPQSLRYRRKLRTHPSLAEGEVKSKTLRLAS